MANEIETVSGNAALIEAAELAALLANSGSKIRLIDATFSTDGRQAYEQLRIGKAAFFDIEAIADQTTALPHMLPQPAEFAAAVAALGISDDDTVIVYDQAGVAMAAARAWWTFRVFGHDNVRVLNGGLPAWLAAGLPVSHATPAPSTPGHFITRFRPELVRSLQDVQTASQTGAAVVLDARSGARFAGQAPEPRAGLRAGHIPGSINIPYTNLLDDNRIKNFNELKAVFKVIPKDKPAIASCGSGVTACVLALGLYGFGRQDVAVYDGSWSEWGLTSSGTPIA